MLCLTVLIESGVANYRQRFSCIDQFQIQAFVKLQLEERGGYILLHDKFSAGRRKILIDPALAISKNINKPVHGSASLVSWRPDLCEIIMTPAGPTLGIL